MKKEEFATAVRGITAERIAELAGKSTATIQSYLTGRREIPLEIARLAGSIEKELNNLKVKENTMNERQMKKIIDGKLYNTATATIIAEYWNGLGSSDFRNISEELYRTKKGKFFIAGNGGPMTKYSESCGDNSRCGGEKIIPLSESEAREWLEEHGTTEDYIATFGEPPEA